MRPYTLTDIIYILKKYICHPIQHLLQRQIKMRKEEFYTQGMVLNIYRRVKKMECQDRTLSPN